MGSSVLKYFAIASATLALLCSCSTTKVLHEGEYRLSKNKVTITNDKKFNERILDPYIKQQVGPSLFGWSPWLSVYNWTNGKGKGWDKFVQKIGRAPVVYDPDLVDSSAENIKRHLEYLGYYDSDVVPAISVKRRLVQVNYGVTLGKRYPIKEFTWEVPGGVFGQTFDSDTTHITVHEGDSLSEASLEEETVRSSQYIRDTGFYGLNKNHYFFEADTLTCPDSAILRMSIKEYTRNETPEAARPLEQSHIGTVTISHPNSLKFSEKVLKNLNTIHPGDLYSETAVANTYSRLSALRVFNVVGIEMSNADSNKVDCAINLSQSKLQGFKLNLEASVNSSGLFGVSPQISYYHKNIFHGGEWLNLGFMGNFQFKFKNKDVHSIEAGVSAGLSLPRFLGLPYRYFKGPNVPRTDFKLSYNYQNRPEYTRNIISASYGYTGTYRDRFSYQVFPAQLSVVRLSKLDENFYNSLKNDPFMRNAYQNHFDLGLGGTLYYTTNTSGNPGAQQFYTRFQLDLAGNLLSAFKPVMKKDEDGHGIIWNTPFSQYVRAEATIGRTWTFGKKEGQAIATRILAGAGYAYGNSTALPFEKHFYAGGANSLRGWQVRSVGPGIAPMDSTFVIPNQTGDMRLEANVEYRFDIIWKFEGAVFVDAGNIWSFKRNRDEDDAPAFINGKTFGDSIALNWGVGLRLDFNFLIVRVDWGLKIHDPSREQKWVNPAHWVKRDGFALHFGVGYPF
ncbi:MAG: BamA/TamA family outer membrane protein [Bacteroidales bacterium]|nr:BamA/TamA family outer membrane protein [Bacteroidales bacterium]